MSFIGAALIGGGLAATGSIGSAAIAAGNQPGGMQQGYDVVQMPQYSFTEPRLRLASDYLTQGLSSLQQGNPPNWYSQYEPILRNQMMTNLQQQTFGTPGNRGAGTFGQTAAMGAQTGVGPGRTFAQGQRALTEYQNRAMQIDTYLKSLGVNAMQQSEANYLGSINQIPQGPTAGIVNLAGGVYGPQGSSPWMGLGSTMAGIGGNINWQQLLQQMQGGQAGGAFSDPSIYSNFPSSFGGMPMTTNPAYYGGSTPLESAFSAMSTY